MANDSVYIGTELKFQVTLQSGGFNMMDDDFEIVVSCGKREVEYKKTDLIIDENDKWYIAIDTSPFKKGDLYATAYAYVPDEDFPDGLRTEVDRQKLATLKEIK